MHRLGEPKRLVLVVDDVEDSRSLYVQHFRRCGLRAMDAEDGLEALTIARRLRPSLIVMDLSMPGLDGLAATRLLKRDAETSHICIIALTGHTERHYRDLAFAAGVTRFLMKPCLPDELLRHVHECFAQMDQAT